MIAASHNIISYFSPDDTLPGAVVETSSGLGYLWVVINCVVSAAYVGPLSTSSRAAANLTRCQRRQILGMRKKIKSMGFTDWQTSFYNNTISIPILMVSSMLLEGWSSDNFTRNLYVPSGLASRIRLLLTARVVLSPEDARTYLFFAMILSGGVAVFISFCRYVHITTLAALIDSHVFPPSVARGASG